VGTIDQALLGVLQTKHFFVRLFGLAGKTVVVDEVHAYDVYMSSLLGRLLEWLGAFGVPVVLLSATLPRAKRLELQQAYARYAGWPTPDDGAADMPYPRLTWRSAEGAGARAVVASAAMSRSVAVEWLEGAAPDSEEGLAALGERLRTLLAQGGCAAVVCNTVGRAQSVYTALKAYFPGVDGVSVLDLFHARFPRGERVKREERVLGRFGTGDGVVRPKTAVLVATQVIEQSLDLDFDLLVSDLAPMDLLLQRSGRLQRHRRNDSQRAAAVATPRLVIPRPEVRDECPRFPRSDEFVYDAYFLLRTWMALRERGEQGRDEIRVPEEIEVLVEQVYDANRTCPEDAPPAVRAAWERTRAKYEHDVEHELDEARMRKVAAPKGDDVYTGRNLKLKEEDEARDAEEAAIALTRLGPPSVRVVLLPAARARREWEAKGKPPAIKEVRELLKQSVAIAHGAVAPALMREEPPVRWKKSPWLRHARLVALDANDQASIQVQGKEGEKARTFLLKLDPELGVIIRRQREEDA
jgi:CRISPR-associated endonuclease/helicase Cas3